MPARSNLEIVLRGEDDDSLHLPLKEPPQWSLTSYHVPRYDVGPSPVAQEQGVSRFGQFGFRGGIGVESGLDPTTADRVWWSTADLRYDRAVVLPRKRYNVTNSPGAGDKAIILSTDFSNNLLVGRNRAIWSLNMSTGAWGSNAEHTASHAPVGDAVKGHSGGKNYVVVACGSSYALRDHDGTWANHDVAMTYLAWDRGTLWGIDENGQLRRATDFTTGTWADNAILPLPSGSVTGLLIHKTASGEALHAITTSGVWVHDPDAPAWLLSSLQWPEFADQGGGANWREELFTPIGQFMFGYRGGSVTNVRPVGPNLDSGLPTVNDGNIVALASSVTDLFAAVTSVTLDEISLYGPQTMGTAFRFATRTSRSLVLAWNGESWQVVWLSAAGEPELASMKVVGNATAYRLYWTVGPNLRYIDLDVTITNPKQKPTHRFDKSAETITPWFDKDDIIDSGLLIDLSIFTLDTTETETVTIEYQIDSVAGWTLVATIRDPDDYYFRLPTTGKPRGVVFRRVRYRIRQVRGDDDTKSPAFVAYASRIRQNIEPRLSWRLAIDVDRLVTSRGFRGKSITQIRKQLFKLLREDPMLEFIYDGETEEKPKYVKIEQAGGIEDLKAEQFPPAWVLTLREF